MALSDFIKKILIALYVAGERIKNFLGAYDWKGVILVCIFLFYLLLIIAGMYFLCSFLANKIPNKRKRVHKLTITNNGNVPLCFLFKESEPNPDIAISFTSGGRFLPLYDETDFEDKKNPNNDRLETPEYPDEIPVDDTKVKEEPEKEIRLVALTPGVEPNETFTGEIRLTQVRPSEKECSYPYIIEVDQIPLNDDLITPPHVKIDGIVCFEASSAMEIRKPLLITIAGIIITAALIAVLAILLF